MSGMKDSEAWAIRKMANAAKRSNVRLARWLEDAPFQFTVAGGIWVTRFECEGRQRQHCATKGNGNNVGNER